MGKINKEKIKTWFVTGASSGIGHEITRQLLERGYNVVAVARRTPEFISPNCLCLSCDVTKPDMIKNAVQNGIQKFGKIDVLVNNAGMLTSATIENETLEHMKEVFEVNFFGIFNTMNILIPHFRENNNGTIINNTSKSGIVPRRFGAAYCSSKHAIEGLTGVCYRECAKFLRVMAFELGWFPESGIKSIQKISIENLPNVYKGLRDIDLPIKYKFENNLNEAVNLILNEAEKSQPPRRFILGYDAIIYAKSELKLFFKDFKHSVKFGSSCTKVFKRNFSVQFLNDYLKYLKYKIFKNFVIGKTRQRYKDKQIKYKRKLNF